MSIANDKIVNLQDAKVLYDDLRGRIKDNSVVKVLDTPAAIQSFSDAARFPMELKVGIDPVQDLHGYDRPWVGGAGKNLLPKGSTSTVSGITFTVNDDGTVLVTGTSTSSASVFWGAAVTLPVGNYILNGCPSGGGNDSYRIDIRNNIGGNMISPNSDTGNGANITMSEAASGYVNIRVGANYAFPSAGLLFKPMLRLSTETDSTFAPYENICPISGWDGAKVTVTGKNLLNANLGAGTINGLTFANAGGVITVNGTATFNVYRKVGAILTENGVQYTLTGCPEGGANGKYRMTVGGYGYDYGSGYTFVGDGESHNISIDIYSSYGAVNNLVFKPMIRFSTVTDATFEPYAGNTYSITFPTSTGTVYGGELTIHSDGSGELVVDRKYAVFDGSNDESWHIAKDGTPSRMFETAVNSSLNGVNQALTQISNCNKKAAVTLSSTDTGFWIINGGQLRVRTPAQESLSDFTASLAQTHMQVVFELGESVTYILTPGQVFAILGTNNIWADCGQINYVEYVRYTVGEVIPNRFDGIEQDIVETNTYEKTISEANAIQSFEDGAEWPMGMQIAVDPVQDLHGYDHPWPGGAGANMWNEEWTNGYYSASTGVLVPAPSSSTLASANHIKVTGGLTICLVMASGSDISIFEYDGNGTYTTRANITTSPVSFTLQSNTAEIAFHIANYFPSASGTKEYKNDVAINFPSTVTTYSPYSNVCPITGWTGSQVCVAGKNHFSGTVYKKNYGINSSGAEYASGSFSIYTDRLKAETNYTVSTTNTGGTANQALRVQYFDRNGNVLGMDSVALSTTERTTLQFTTPAFTDYVHMSVLNTCTEIQIEKGTTANEYETYAGFVYPITFPASAGTVYGGTLTVNKDGTGTLVVKEEKVSLDGNQNWTIISSRNGFRLASVLPSHESGYPTKCEWLKTKTTVSTETGVVLGAENSHLYVDGVINVIPGVTDVESWKTYLDSNPLVLTKPIEPVTYSLTAPQVLSLIGQNHVWADCGDILSLTYNSKQGIEFIREDTAGQINTVVNPVKEELADAEAAMAIVVDGDTAPKNITSGQYVFVKNHSTLATGLYHAMAAISSGASITSSNVEADADGGLNALTTVQTITGITKGTKVNSANYINSELCGKLCCIKGYFSINDSLATGDVLFNIPSNIQPISGRNYFVVYVTNTDRFILLTIGTQIKVESLLGNTFSSGDVFVFSYYYFIG